MEGHSFTLTNDPSQVRGVQTGLTTLLQASGVRLKIVTALTVALGECLENIIQYAYGDHATHTITVECVVAPAEIVLRVTDDGRPFDPCTVAAPDTAAAGAQQALTGRGIHLIRHLVDCLSYERAEGQNVLTMAKDCRRDDDF